VKFRNRQTFCYDGGPHTVAVTERIRLTDNDDGVDCIQRRNHRGPLRPVRGDSAAPVMTMIRSMRYRLDHPARHHLRVVCPTEINSTIRPRPSGQRHRCSVWKRSVFLLCLRPSSPSVTRCLLAKRHRTRYCSRLSVCSKGDAMAAAAHRPVRNLERPTVWSKLENCLRSTREIKQKCFY